jgi:hypothetical protein
MTKRGMPGRRISSQEEAKGRTVTTTHPEYYYESPGAVGGGEMCARVIRVFYAERSIMIARRVHPSETIEFEN